MFVGRMRRNCFAMQRVLGVNNGGDGRLNLEEDGRRLIGGVVVMCGIGAAECDKENGT